MLADVSWIGFGRAVVGVCNNVGRSALAHAPNNPAHIVAKVREAIIRL
jgi:hypothetical protein